MHFCTCICLQEPLPACYTAAGSRKYSAERGARACVQNYACRYKPAAEVVIRPGTKDSSNGVEFLLFNRWSVSTASFQSTVS